MYCKSIIFTDAPLVKGYRYKDGFQLVPLLQSSSKAPISHYCTHFPCFLEYQVEGVEEVLEIEDELRRKGMPEDELRRKGMPEDVIKMGRKLPEQTRARKEILHLLSALTNFRFFEYSEGSNFWGIQAPMKDVDDLTFEELERLNNQTSHWTVRGYVYPDCAEDFKIKTFTKCTDYYVAENAPIEYFTVNPNIGSNPQIKIPPYLDFVIDRYFSLPDNERDVAHQCLGLLYEGIELFDTHRSVSLLSIISSIEGMARLDWEKYEPNKPLGPKSRFRRYLKTYVAGKSESKFNAYYDKRCEITHDGRLFLGDIDLFQDIHKQDDDWLFRLEVLQAARLAIYNWLRRKDVAQNKTETHLEDCY